MDDGVRYVCQIWTVLALVHNAQAKTCQTLHLTQAVYNPGTNGYYDLMAGSECKDRAVYEQRTPYDDNNTSRYYMYYGDPDELSHGWVVGPDPCSETAYVYNWNNNKRPDYTLRYWIEREGNIWYYSFDLRVKCTEGLSFGELIGVIIGSIIAVPVIGLFIYFIVKKIKNKRKARTRQSNRENSTRNDRMIPSEPTINTSDYGVPNYAFNNSDGTMYPTMDVAPPYHVMAPPLYDEINAESGTTSAHPGDGNETKPPTYEDVLAEMGEIQAVDSTGDVTVAHGESSEIDRQYSMTSIEVVPSNGSGSEA